MKALGGKRNNSTSLAFPQHIPEKYLADFIRGYFDGDGSVHFITYKASKNGKMYTETRSNFTCGSIEFLESLREILSMRLGLSKRTVSQYGPHQFKLGYGQRDTHKLLRYLYYPGHKISLSRKEKYLHTFDK